jgi:predicted NAD-dependent protein-ADP-ribosyltransferase YbiA (DUF1768 family)
MDKGEVKVLMNSQDPPYGSLTNSAAYPFTLNGKTWPTVVSPSPSLSASLPSHGN